MECQHCLLCFNGQCIRPTGQHNYTNTMNNVTWTIRVKNSSRKYWGNSLDSCWSRLRWLHHNKDSYFVLKILYHGASRPPQHVSAGLESFQDVAVFFSSTCDDTEHRWYARAVDSQKMCNCSNWNTSEIEQFISFYNQ